MCLRPHCGQRVRTLYLAADFVGSSVASDDLMFVPEWTTVINPFPNYGEDGASQCDAVQGLLADWFVSA